MRIQSLNSAWQQLRCVTLVAQLTAVVAASRPELSISCISYSW